jgi:hypothetical protein
LVNRFARCPRTIITCDAPHSVLEWNLSFGARDRAQTNQSSSGWINVAREMANRELSNAEAAEAFGKLQPKLYAPLWTQRN